MRWWALLMVIVVAVRAEEEVRRRQDTRHMPRSLFFEKTGANGRGGREARTEEDNPRPPRPGKGRGSRTGAERGREQQGGESDYMDHITLQRRRMMRIFNLQLHIINSLGFKEGPPNISQIYSKEEIEELRNYTMYILPENDSNKTLTSGHKTENHKPTLPSCELPRNTEATWWEDEEKLRLYFEVKPQLPSNGRQVIVASANLHLFVKPQQAQTDPPREDEIRNEDDDEEVTSSSRRRGRARRSSRSGRTADREELREPQEEEEDVIEEVEEDDEDEEEDEDMLTVIVYRYDKPVKKKQRREKITEVMRTLIPVDFEGWLKLDVTAAVTRWINMPRKNFGLKVTVLDSAGVELNAREVIHGLNCSTDLVNASLPLQMAGALGVALNTLSNMTVEGVDQFNASFPLLDLSTVTREAAPSPRQRRAARPILKKARRCSMKKMEVAFEAPDWNWIIAPRSFETGYCVGSCQSPITAKGIRKRFSKKQVAQFGSDECCGPTKVKPLKLIHFVDGGEVVFSVLDDFIVEECGCRD